MQLGNHNKEMFRRIIFIFVNKLASKHAAIMAACLITAGLSSVAFAEQSDFNSSESFADMLNYDDTMQVPLSVLNNGVCVSRTVEKISENEYVVTTITEEQPAMYSTKTVSGTRTSTVKKEHFIKGLNNENIITGVAYLTCKFSYNDDNDYISCTSKSYSFSPESGVTMTKKDLTVKKNSGFLFVKPSVTVKLDYTFTSAIGMSTDHSLKITCNTEGNIS